MARKAGRIQCKGRLFLAAANTAVIVSIASVTLLPNDSIDEATASPAAPGSEPQISAAAVATVSTTQTDEPSCPAEETYIAPEHVGVEGAPTCLPIGSGLSESHVDPLYADIALEILRLAAPLDEQLEIRKPKVVCWGLNDWKNLLELFRGKDVPFGTDLAGWVPGTNRVINLSYMTCKRLGTIAYEGKMPEDRLFAGPVWILAHETIHLGGIPHEGTADCYAKQLVYFTAGLLGADSAAARTVASLGAEQAKHARAGTEYDDPNCHDNGPLDIDTDDVVWS